MNPSRPLTHDLMKNFMLAFNVDLHEIIINDLQEGIFFSKLVCSSEKETIEIDSRTSDALALAVRFGCPIYTYENILSQAGVSMEEENRPALESGEESRSTSTAGPGDNLKNKTLDELEALLKEVLENEDYLRAIAIRDEINSRQQK
jgi:bifunctional DNase/RNase